MDVLINPPKNEWHTLCQRPVIETAQLDKLCKEIFEQVEKFGDEALLRYTKLFDNVEISSIQVSPDEIREATNRVPDEMKQAMELAMQNIHTFHQAQELKSQKIQTSPGVECWQESRPIEKIGIYIPGGSAPLFSTVLMLAVPAKIAGCREIVLCSPPGKSGKLADEILYAAQQCGVDKIYKVGGIQAVAAMSMGTASVSKVYKIFGPGNQYVTAAKLYAQRLGIAIDMPAGPSELLVVADESAVPGYVAADLLSQAEHGADSQVVLLTPEISIVDKVRIFIERQLNNMPRKLVAEKAMANSKFIVLPKKADCLEFINQYAPEHLILAVNNPEDYRCGIMNAGSVFIGNYTPESAGDYASGTNHTLPTDGHAKAYSGINLDAFVKKITFQEVSKKGLQHIGPAIETMALAEGLFAHKYAVSVRLQDLQP
jgi:histidinol dehydrogenase